MGLLFETEIKKLNQFIKEIQNEIQEKNYKKLETIDKAENSLQEYNLLFSEINSLKQALIPQCKKINQKVLNNILQIGNPNDSIYFLMKTFYWIIKGFNNEDNIQKKNNIEWKFLQNNLNYDIVLSYLSFISNSNMSYLTNEDLDEAMPFLVNYEKLKNIFINISKDLIIILDFIKLSLELNVKINIMNSLYESNCNKNNKIENIDILINNLNNLLKNSKLILSQINKDYNYYKELNNNNDEEGLIKNSYLILEKYSLYEKYSVEKEKHHIDDISTIKYIIKLNKKYRDKEYFITHLSTSLINFNKGIRKLNENEFIIDIKNNNLKKKNIKSRNYDKKFDLNSIKEENYLSSLNSYSNNISELDNLTGRYSYNYNYNWFKNNDDNIISFNNKNNSSLVIKGNLEKNFNFKKNLSIKKSTLNYLLKKNSDITAEYEKTKSSELSEKNKNKNKKIKDSNMIYYIPQEQGSLTLEKEENNNYCSYSCFKNIV